MADRELTDKQKLFLDALFGVAEGDLRLAMNTAGYSPSTPISIVAAALHDEILDRTRKYVAASAPQAALKLVSIMLDPTNLGNMTLLSAVKEILDRAGVTKPEKLTLEGNIQGGLFILPAKQET